MIFNTLAIDADTEWLMVDSTIIRAHRHAAGALGGNASDYTQEIQLIEGQDAKHIVTENERTLEAKEAMLANDSKWLGSLMKASHISLRDDFEVSSTALNIMVDLANGFEGCFGARMTGAGFGGCAVALVEKTKVEAFVRYMSGAYQAGTGNEPQIYVSEPEAGASVEMG